MGGGDLNMKKSWHPLLLKNQERVWLEEKKALEEKKKLDQLRKEKEEERQLQELQRLQEEQTGKKRTDKLEWMYATPAAGSGANQNDLEDYLLGKKRVDKILTADDNAKLGASHKSFIAVQNANNVRDMAAKIREDPLLAIKQQEQAAYQALMNNPLRLRELQERNGIKVKKDKKDKKKEKEEKRRRVVQGLQSTIGVTDENQARTTLAARGLPDRHIVNMTVALGMTPRIAEDETARRKTVADTHYPLDPHVIPKGIQIRLKALVPRNVRNDLAVAAHLGGMETGTRGLTNEVGWTGPPRNNGPTQEERAAKLAAMQSNATGMGAERKERLAALLEKEKAELAAEEQKRSKGMNSYLNSESKRVFGGAGGLEDRIRRGRGGMVIDAD